MRRFGLMLAILTAICGAAKVSYSSSASGSIVGTIVDQSGAVIVGAAVEIHNQNCHRDFPHRRNLTRLENTTLYFCNLERTTSPSASRASAKEPIQGSSFPTSTR